MVAPVGIATSNYNNSVVRSTREATISKSNGTTTINTRGGSDQVNVHYHADGSSTVTINGERNDLSRHCLLYTSPSPRDS